MRFSLPPCPPKGALSQSRPPLTYCRSRSPPPASIQDGYGAQALRATELPFISLVGRPVRLDAQREITIMWLPVTASHHGAITTHTGRQGLIGNGDRACGARSRNGSPRMKQSLTSSFRTPRLCRAFSFASCVLFARGPQLLMADCRIGRDVVRAG